MPEMIEKLTAQGVERFYRCNDSQSYHITEYVCDARQARKTMECRTCPYRIGGKKDQRPTRAKK